MLWRLATFINQCCWDIKCHFVWRWRQFCVFSETLWNLLRLKNMHVFVFLSSFFSQMIVAMNVETVAITPEIAADMAEAANGKWYFSQFFLSIHRGTWMFWKIVKHPDLSSCANSADNNVNRCLAVNSWIFIWLKRAKPIAKKNTLYFWIS